jgi:hypothetical protein
MGGTWRQHDKDERNGRIEFSDEKRRSLLEGINLRIYLETLLVYNQQRDA